MKRRQAIKTLLAATASSMLFTSCAESNVIEFLNDGKLLLNKRHQKYLGIISESILPIKDISDKIEPASSFILRMINDCNEPEDIEKFTVGFDQYKVLMTEAQSKISLKNADQAVDMMKEIVASTVPQEELAYFIEEVKNLSIQNLKTSSFYLTQKTDYQLIPEPYQACAEA